MIPFLLLALAKQAIPSPDGPQRDYPLQTYFSYAESSRVTAPCLVECLAPGSQAFRRYEYEKPDPGEDEGARRAVRVETVRVVDSTALARGSTVQIVAAGDSMFAPQYRMVPGRRYLVLAGLPRNGRLEAPHSGLFGTGADTSFARPGEISGFAAFESHAWVLDGSPNVANGIANSVVDCVPGSDAAGVHRVALRLKSSRYPNSGPYRSAFGQEPFSLSKKLRNDVTGASAYVRYEAFQVLCDWGVYGSEQGWVDAMLDLAKEPADPFLPGDTITGGELTFSQARRVQDPTYVPVRLDGNRWADAIIDARNDAVRGLLLTEVTRDPDEAHALRLARALLASPNERLVFNATAYLARVLKRPDLAPQYRNEGERVVWTNRDASLAFLRERYGVTAPRATP